jgi:hypothetical protein
MTKGKVEAVPEVRIETVAETLAGVTVKQRTMTRQECQRPLGFGEEVA